jgi:FKBP-type peptidyl-prolyl cis-trans isomerase SlyD
MVAWVGLETVKLDFNHPMAGVDLFFTGHVDSVRDAEPEELAHGHVHGPGGHHH